MPKKPTILSPDQRRLIEEDRSRNFMRVPGDWPAWPWLPLKRVKDERFQYGVLHADDTDAAQKPRVWIINLFEIRSYFPDLKWQHEQYSDLDSICADGWRVD